MNFLEKVAHAVEGAAGAFTAALLFGVVALRIASPTDAATRRRLVMEGVVSVVAGALTAAFVGPALAQRVGATTAEQFAAVCFCVGAASWRVTPALIVGVEAFVKRRLPT